MNFRVTAERERQRNIAKERLEARKLKKQQKNMAKDDMKKLAEDEEMLALEEAVRDSEGNATKKCVCVSGD